MEMDKPVTAEELQEIYQKFFTEKYPVSYVKIDLIKINKKLTIKERITEKIQSWHSRMAVWHERRSIGLK